MSYRRLHLFLARHGEADHNVATKNREHGTSRRSVFINPLYHDARLTEKGKQQAQSAAVRLRAQIADVNKKGKQSELLLVSSPLMRAIETAKSLCPESESVTVLECIREIAGEHACDARHSRSEIEHFLSKECNFPSYNIDLYQDADPFPLSHPRETKIDLEKRCWEFLVWLSDLACNYSDKEVLIVVAVSHSAFLRSLFAVTGLCNPAEKKFSNLEIRHLEINCLALINYVFRENPFKSEFSKNLRNYQNYNPPVIPVVTSVAKYPHVKPAFPLDFSKFTTNPVLHYHEVSSLKLSHLYPPNQPFSLAIFPPLSTSSLIETNQSCLEAIDLLLTLGSSSEFFSTTTFVEEVLLGESCNQYQRNRLIEDARHVIQFVDSEEKYEAVCKETIHDQNCIVFLLPSVLNQYTVNILPAELNLVKEAMLSAGALSVHFIFTV